jgi:outer membrane protein assembly factor BamE
MIQSIGSGMIPLSTQRENDIPPNMRKHLIIITYLASLFLTACVYKIDVQQGNIVTQEMIDQLRPSMNKRQVRFVMGTPLLVDPFQPERWDYIYSNQPGGEERVQKRITLLFENDGLVGLQGDFRPSGMPVVEPSADRTVIVPKRDIDKTLFQMIKSLFIWEDDDQPIEEEGDQPLEEGDNQPAEEE